MHLLFIINMYPILTMRYLIRSLMYQLYTVDWLYLCIYLSYQLTNYIIALNDVIVTVLYTSGTTSSLRYPVIYF